MLGWVKKQFRAVKISFSAYVKNNQNHYLFSIQGEAALGMDEVSAPSKATVLICDNPKVALTEHWAVFIITIPWQIPPRKPMGKSETCKINQKRIII